jgi:hypothetical protein
MREKFNIENSNYECIKEREMKKISDQTLIEKVQNTYKFLKLSEIYLKDVKDDYGKKKIASYRVDFVRHQLDLLMRECFARGINHSISDCYPIG